MDLGFVIREFLRRGEVAAFQGAPGAGVEPLTSAIKIATAGEEADLVAAATWLLGVCYAGAGKFGSAVTALNPALVDPQTQAQRHFAARSAATIASTLRQISLHDQARPFDEAAIAFDPLGPGEFDGFLGLAADAVGVADATAAQDHWETALTLADPTDWRQSVRLNWVAAEIALLTDDAVSALDYAEAAVHRAQAVGAPRHASKSLLFVGVAQLQLGSPTSLDSLREGLNLARQLGADPLIWPFCSVLLEADLEVDAQESSLWASAAGTAIRSICADLPGDQRAKWSARPRISELIGSSYPQV